MIARSIIPTTFVPRSGTLARLLFDSLSVNLDSSYRIGTDGRLRGIQLMLSNRQGLLSRLGYQGNDPALSVLRHSEDGFRFRTVSIPSDPVSLPLTPYKLLRTERDYHLLLASGRVTVVVVLDQETDRVKDAYLIRPGMGDMVRWVFQTWSHSDLDLAWLGGQLEELYHGGGAVSLIQSDPEVSENFQPFLPALLEWDQGKTFTNEELEKARILFPGGAEDAFVRGHREPDPLKDDTTLLDTFASPRRSGEVVYEGRRYALLDFGGFSFVAAANPGAHGGVIFPFENPEEMEALTRFFPDQPSATRRLTKKEFEEELIPWLGRMRKFTWGMRDFYAEEGIAPILRTVLDSPTTVNYSGPVINLGGVGFTVGLREAVQTGRWDLVTLHFPGGLPSAAKLGMNMLLPQGAHVHSHPPALFSRIAFFQSALPKALSEKYPSMTGGKSSTGSCLILRGCG